MAYIQAGCGSNGYAPGPTSRADSEDGCHVALKVNQLKTVFNDLLDSVATSPETQAARLDAHVHQIVQRHEEHLRQRLEELCARQGDMLRSQIDGLARQQSQYEELFQRHMQRLQEDDERRAESARQQEALRVALVEAQKLCASLREVGQREAPAPAPFKAPPQAHQQQFFPKAPPVQESLSTQPSMPVAPLSTSQDTFPQLYAESRPPSKPPPPSPGIHRDSRSPEDCPRSPNTESRPPPSKPPPSIPPSPAYRLPEEQGARPYSHPAVESSQPAPELASARSGSLCMEASEMQPPPIPQASGNGMMEEWNKIRTEEAQAPAPRVRAPSLPMEPPPYQDSQFHPPATKAPPSEAASYLSPVDMGTAQGNSKSSPPYKAPPQALSPAKTTPPYKAPPNQQVGQAPSPPMKAPPPSMANGKRPPPPLPPQNPVPFPQAQVQY